MDSKELETAPALADPVDPPTVSDEDDTSGHMSQNWIMARELSRAREADIQRSVSRHTLEAQARRPHKRESR